LTGLPSELVGAGVDAHCDMSRCDDGAGEGVSKGTWRSSILMVVGTESVGGGVIAPEAMSVDVVIVCEKKESKCCGSIPLVLVVVDAW
tara:strand:+ start:20884 stop:21147 length:264 start_codon:yes stop_codon:yes gene_type:complete